MNGCLTEHFPPLCDKGIKLNSQGGKGGRDKLGVRD